MGDVRLDARPKGPGRVPWVRKQFSGFPSIVNAGDEVVLLSLEGFTSACDAYYNPNGNTLPANTYELRLYACGTNSRFLAARVTLGSTVDPPPLSACMAAQRWEVAVGLLLATTPPTWTTSPPTVVAYSHGRERG